MVLLRHADPVLDADGCAEIYAPFVIDSPVSMEEEAPDAGEFTRRIERTSARYPWLVADDRGRVAGYAYASRHHERVGYRWAADVAVYVASGRRRHGIGRALYRALLPLLIRQGIQVACAGVTLPNEASVALHESFGFELVGIYRRIGWKAGAWRDVGWWQLELVPAGTSAPPELGPPARLEELGLR